MSCFKWKSRQLDSNAQLQIKWTDMVKAGALAVGFSISSSYILFLVLKTDGINFKIAIWSKNDPFRYTNPVFFKWPSLRVHIQWVPCAVHSWQLMYWICSSDSIESELSLIGVVGLEKWQNPLIWACLLDRERAESNQGQTCSFSSI